ncbi:MAG TPA: Gldg family protein [Gemmatimonadales bacterium]|nr:Gldg family protein [Gemmatimonadales bacterium]
MSRIWTVARRELKALFDHPTGYVLLVVFLAANAFLFFRQAYLSGAASLRPMLDLLPWVFLFFVPAVTMRTLAEDTRSGLLEVVLAQPLSELELLLGKYLGSVLFLWTALALTLPIPLGLAIGADLHWGPIAAQYVGAMLLAVGLAGVGVWASSLTRSQITAFIAAVAVMFLLILVGLDPLIVGLPATLGALAARLGVLSHFENIGRGVIDLRDALYFVSLAGVFLALAYGALLGRKLAPASPGLRRLRLGVGLLVAVLLVTTLLGSYIGGRLDLTPGKAYTLSDATRDIVRGADDIVTIKLFASRELPTEVSLMKRDVDDLLRDLRAAGRGRVRVVARDPAESDAARRDAQSLGIQPVQFNVLGQSELRVKEGYLGLAVQYADQVETIPFIRRTDDLEYRIAAAIRNLSRTRKPVVGLVDATTAAGLSFRALEEQLGKSYDVRPFTLADTAQPTDDVAAVVLLGSPDSLDPAARARLERVFARGGGALILAGGMALSPQLPMASPKPVAWNALLERFGVSIRSDMVYDLVANEIVPLSTDFGRVLAQYPLFLRARSTGASVVNQEVDDVVLTWASSVDTSKAAAGSVTPLLVSSQAAGAFTGDVTIDPNRDWPRDSLGPRLLAAQVVRGAGADTTARGRVVVVGNAEFASDRFVRGAPQNLAFALNAVDWLSQDESLIAIRSKDRRPPALVFESAAAREGVKYANVVGVPALVAVAGLIRLIRRRRRTQEPYRPLAAGEMITA